MATLLELRETLERAEAAEDAGTGTYEAKRAAAIAYQKALRTIPLESLKTRTLGDVERLHREGFVIDADFAEYLHFWQSSAPRFALQVCRCAPCLATGPASEGR